MILNGKSEEIFGKVGKEYKSEINGLIDYVINDALYKKLENNSWIIEKSMKITKEKCPVPWRDLEVISESSGINLEDLFILNAMSDLLDLEKSTGKDNTGECSSVWKDGFLAQTWDFNKTYENKSFVAVMDSGDKKTAMLSYYGNIGLTGFNNRGIGCCTNKVSSKKAAPGIAYPFYIREILSRNRFSDVLDWIMNNNMIAGRSLLMAGPGNIMCNMESAANEKEIIIKNNGYYAHTNHYLSSGFKKIERDQKDYEWEHTVKRLEIANGELESLSKPSIDNLRKILSIHGDYGKGSGICSHNYYGSLTCGAVVMDLNKLKGCFYLSNPCNAKEIEVVF